MREEYAEVPVPPAPGFGDSIGAHDDCRRDDGRALPPRAHRRGDGGRRLAARHRHVGNGSGLRAVAAARHAVAPPPAAAMRSNPLVRNYLTKDGQWLALCCLQAGKYWAAAGGAIGQPELGSRRAVLDHEALMSNCAEATAILRQRLRRTHRGGMARRARRLHRSVDGRAGHAAGRSRSAGRRQRLRPDLHD